MKKHIEDLQRRINVLSVCEPNPPVLTPAHMRAQAKLQKKLTEMKETALNEVKKFLHLCHCASPSAQEPVAVDWGQPVHDGHACKHCDEGPICGTRYVCSTCEDKSICHDCLDQHPQEHVLTMHRLADPADVPNEQKKWRVNKICNHRVVNGLKEYLINWEGPWRHSWHIATELNNQSMIDEYHRLRRKRLQRARRDDRECRRGKRRRA